MLNSTVLLTVSVAILAQHAVSQDVTLTSTILNTIQITSINAENGWTIVNGAANTIAFGADGSMWSLGIDQESGGYGIYKWLDSQNTWKYMYGSAIKLAVDPLGNAWVITRQNQIYRWTSSGWEILPGRARDITISSDGNAWVLGTEQFEGSYAILKWNEWQRSWTPINGRAVTIAAGPPGTLLGTNNQSFIISYDGADWYQFPGGSIKARQIAIGADGSIFIVGANVVYGGRQTYKWDSQDNVWIPLPVGANQIAVDPNGNPTFVNRYKQIIQYDPAKLIPCTYDSWELLPGSARDVGIGTDGSLWIIGNEQTTGGYKIYRWVPYTKTWWEAPGGGNRITVARDGNAWIVDNQNAIWRWSGIRWERMPGSAYDIEAGASGSVWIVSTEQGPNGYLLYRWQPNTETWEQVSGSGTRIAVDANDKPYLVTNQNLLYEWNGTEWLSMNVNAQEIAVGGDGTLYAVGTDQEKGGYRLQRWDEDRQSWEVLPGEVGGLTLDVDSYGNPYVVDDFEQLIRPKC